LKSTSFHRISADNKSFIYRIFARILHTPFNFLNNLFPDKNIDGKIKFSDFKLYNFEIQYNKLHSISSPSRKLSELFWQNLIWEELKDKNNEINICDLGCGSGNYYQIFQGFSNNKISFYKGLDIYKNENWKILCDKFQNVEFQNYNGINILDLIPKKTNLIVSQSAIEHFTEDVTIFKQIMSFVEIAQHKVTQIHLFPSKICLRNYPFHGVRQYTPRNISKITKLFSDICNVELISLGGKFSNEVHQKYINKSLFNKDLRNFDSEKYNLECYNAFQKDFDEKSNEIPHFYALIIN
jgi:hypothetical protein